MFQKIDGFLLYAVQDLTDFSHFLGSGKPALHRQSLAKKYRKFRNEIFTTMRFVRSTPVWYPTPITQVPYHRLLDKINLFVL